MIGTGFPETLQSARQGSEHAWERLYDDLAPGVLGYLRARGAPDPDGVCGEVFYQLVRDLDRFEGDEEGFRSWVFVMAHHRMLDDMRRRKRRPEILADPEAELWEATSDQDVAGDVVARLGDGELRGLIEELTECQRDVLLLRIFGGMSVAETARIVGKRQGAVKALQRRGLETLRDRLEKWAMAC